MKKDNVNQKLALLLHQYKEDPILFFSSALDVELDKQQLSCLSLVIKPGSRVAIRSARGTGKTFLLAGITLWFLLTHDDVSIRILSPSHDQLVNVFMREVRKLHARLPRILQDLLEVLTDKIVSKMNETNFAKVMTANSDKPESLSGQHSDTQVILYDEMSAIDDEVFNITLGSLGTALGGGYVLGVSNPTRSTGFYNELFDKKQKSWSLLVFTAIDCPRISSAFIEEQEELYGVDSDAYRINVLGLFPRSDSSVFIPPVIVEEAMTRNMSIREYSNDVIVMGVDVARSKSGDDTCLIIRQGPKVHDLIAFKSDDLMEVVARVADAVREYKVNLCFVDATGVGGGVADRARELGLPAIDVMVGSASSDPTQYFNMRAQLYGEIREWLDTGSLINNDRLRKELSEIYWGYSSKLSIQLMSKRNMRSKGVSSPDYADALSLTFYDVVLSRKQGRSRGKRAIRKTSYLFA